MVGAFSNRRAARVMREVGDSHRRGASYASSPASRLVGPWRVLAGR
jgi:hypothetical protein